MKIHHLNCGSFCPTNFFQLKPFLNKVNNSKLARKVIDVLRENVSISEITPQIEIEKTILKDLKCLVTHCVLIETSNKLILIDTGVGEKFIKEHSKRKVLDQFAVKLMGAKLDFLETAKNQIKKAGFSPTDVTDIVISHFDFDHVSGLMDFPNAKAHCFKKEFKFSSNFLKSNYNKHRFQDYLWKNHKNWEKHSLPLETKYHLKMMPIFDDENLYLTHLPGHTPYQAGVFFENQKLLFAADSYLHHQQIENFPKNPLIVRPYQNLTTECEDTYFKTIKKIKKLKESGIKTFCSHDPTEFGQNF